VKALFSHFIRDTNFWASLPNCAKQAWWKTILMLLNVWLLEQKNLTNEFFKQCFISGLKEEIKAQVEMNHPATWLEATQLAHHAQVISYAQSKCPNFAPCPHPNMVAPQQPTPPLKVHKLTWDEMVECQLKGLCYNCDEKYSPGHKCKEHKLFMAIFRTFMMMKLMVDSRGSHSHH
jgi:hypothetical protein